VVQFSAWEGDLSSPTLPDTAPRPTLNPMQWVLDALFVELKWPGCGTDDSHKLVLRLRTNGVTNPLQQMHSWHSYMYASFTQGLNSSHLLLKTRRMKNMVKILFVTLTLTPNIRYSPHAT
jgi:hypothetical protein